MRGRGKIGADNGIRTRDPQLGKLMLYQLSYVRSHIRYYSVAKHVYARTPEFLVFSRATPHRLRDASIPPIRIPRPLQGETRVQRRDSAEHSLLIDFFGSFVRRNRTDSSFRRIKKKIAGDNVSAILESDRFGPIMRHSGYERRDIMNGVANELVLSDERNAVIDDLLSVFFDALAHR